MFQKLSKTTYNTRTERESYNNEIQSDITTDLISDVHRSHGVSSNIKQTNLLRILRLPISVFLQQPNFRLLHDIWQQADEIRRESCYS